MKTAMEQQGSPYLVFLDEKFLVKELPSISVLKYKRILLISGLTIYDLSAELDWAFRDQWIMSFQLGWISGLNNK